MNTDSDDAAVRMQSLEHLPSETRALVLDFARLVARIAAREMVDADGSYENQRDIDSTASRLPRLPRDDAKPLC